MLLNLSASFNRLRAALRRQPACPPVPLPDHLIPLAHPDATLPAWVAQDPLVAEYRALLGCLPWADFPERPQDRN